MQNAFLSASDFTQKPEAKDLMSISVGSNGVLLHASLGGSVTEVRNDEGEIIGWGYTFTERSMNDRASYAVILATFKSMAEEIGITLDEAALKEVYFAALPKRKPRRFSRIKLELAIAKLGIWPEVKAWLNSIQIAPGYTALDAEQSVITICEDFEGVTEWIDAAVTFFKLDYAVAESVLNASVE